MRRLLPAALSLGLLAGCKPSPIKERLPTSTEASPETVIANYAPKRLRVFPALGTGESAPAGSLGAVGSSLSSARRRYVVLASEHPELHATFRPLGVTEKRAPEGSLARAGELAWVDGHVLEAAEPPAGAAFEARLRIYDADGQKGVVQALPLPGICTQPLPPLIQAHSDQQSATLLVRCSAERRAVLITVRADGSYVGSRTVENAGDAEHFLHHGDADYLLMGRKVMRVAANATRSTLPTIGTVPPPLGGPETRELLRSGETLLVIDGAASRVIGMDAEKLGWKFERHLPTVGNTGDRGRLTRLRAALSHDRVHIVVAEAKGPETYLYGLGMAVDGKEEPPLRLILGTTLPTSDHELVPIAAADGGGTMLVRTHAGNTGPVVTVTRLAL